MVSLAPDLHAPRKKAVVIGAGIAGLACALRLACSGLSVTLLERHEHSGGKIRTTPSDAGPVDAGPTVLTLRHVFEDLFATAGEKLDDHVTLVAQDTLARHHWPDGSKLDLFASPEKSAQAIRDFAGPRDSDAFLQFNARTARLYEAFDAPMMQAVKPDMARLVPQVLRQPGLLRAMAPLSTLAGSLSRQFKDPRLAQLFGRYATYVGGAPHLSPALLALIWRAEAGGVWVVEGGMHRLAKAIADLCIAQNVDIRHNTHAAELLLDAGRVCGVATQAGDTLTADIVVHAGDPRALAAGALGHAARKVARQTLRQPRSYSARVYSFAAIPHGTDLVHHNVFFAADPMREFHDLTAGRIPRDPTLYLCAEDRGLGQPTSGLERFEIIANAPATPSQTQPTDLDQWHQQIIRTMAAQNVTFTPTPSTQTITTPQDFARLFPQTHGALYGQTPHGMTAALHRPTARTSIPGLYLASGGAHPGAGLPMATLSARHAVAAILQDQTSMSMSTQTAMRGGMSTA